MIYTFIFGLTLMSQNQPPPSNLPSIREILLQGIYERSPLGRYEAGDLSPGVKSFRTEPRCLMNDLIQVFELQEPPQKVRIPAEVEVFKDKIDHLRTRDLSIEIKDFETQLIRELQTEIEIFNRSGDPMLRKREICMGSAEFSSPNAVSIGYGFMVFDPQLFFQIIRSEKSNSWSLRAVVAHELAHQFQIWHRDPTLFKTKNQLPYVRDKELQADCVAAAILAQEHEIESASLPQASLDFKTAVFDAFISLGDFEFGLTSSHHGTAYERSLMVSTGLNVQEKIKSGQILLSSGEILKACRERIDTMNEKFGDELWPFGSQP